jgi:hypothetical protein
MPPAATLREHIPRNSLIRRYLFSISANLFESDSRLVIFHLAMEFLPESQEMRPTKSSGVVDSRRSQYGSEIA